MPITRSSSLRGAGAAVALLLTSCGDPTTAPSSVSTAAGSVSRWDQAIPNSVKYRDRGHRPATGRSGSATLTVSALLGKSGATDVEVAAGSLDGTGSPMLAKAKLDASRTDGEHIFTVNDNHLSARTAAFSFNGLMRNDRLRVHANVRGVNGARTNVVVVDQVIKLRPDIAVADVQAPTEAWTHTPTIVGATLRELNGDVGARTTCRLEVDGIAVDSAANAWVDAGGTVSCSFAFMFDEAGEHTLTVRATRVEPADWDDANNSADVVVQVSRDVPLSYTATAEDDSLRSWQLGTEVFRALYQPLYESTRADTMSQTGRLQSSYLTAFTRDPVSLLDGPVRDVRMSQRTGNVVVHEATYDALPAENITTGEGWIQACVTRSGGAIVASFTLCSRRETVDGVTSTFTNVTYRWSAGDVTYRSDGYFRFTCFPWSHGCGVSSSYTWNYERRDGQGMLVSFGSEFMFDVEFWSGSSRFRAAPTVPLTFAHVRVHQPPSCTTVYTMQGPFGGIGYLTGCQERFEESWTLSGSVSGT